MKSKKIYWVVASLVIVLGIAYFMNSQMLQGRFAGKLPDLAVQDISVDENNVLTVEVGNESSKSVRSSVNGTTFIYIEDMSDPVWTYSWSTLSDQAFRNAGKSSVLTPQEINDVYTIQVCIDATEVVSESNESNNCLSEVVSPSDAEYVTKGSLWNDLLVDAGYTLSTCTGGMYPDVDASHEYCAAIETATNEGLTLGYTDGTFGPDDLVNRSEGSKVAYLVYGLSSYTPASPSFDDISSGAWYEEYIESLNVLGVYEYSTGSFHPDELLTQYALDIWMSNL